MIGERKSSVRARLAVLAGTALILYLIAVPVADMLVDSMRPRPSQRNVPELTTGEWLRIRTTEVVVAFWFFALGGTLGSFLNVVAHRLPRGESVVFRASRCPACLSPIAPRDNLPIVGWLALSGKCRNCGVAISPRYPIVEAIVACGFLLLYFVELLSGGANIPDRMPNTFTGVVWVVLYTKWDLVSLYLFHCALWCVLLTWALLAIDGHRPGWQSVVGVIASAFVAGSACPWLVPVPIGGFERLWGLGDSSELALARMVVGVSAGLAIATGIWSARHLLGNHSSHRWIESAAGFAPIGAILGWQAVLAIAILAQIARAACGVCARGQLGTCKLPVVLAAVTLVHQVFWREWATRFATFWPGPHPTWVNTGGPCLALVAMTAVVEILERTRMPADD